MWRYLGRLPNLKHIAINKVDFVVISCGINDIHGQYGASFYSWHT